MTIYIPYVRGMLREETEEWYGDHPEARLWSIDPADRTGYWQMINHVWKHDRFDDLLIVEQDMLPAPGVVEEMQACSHMWCVSPYQCSSQTLDVPLLTEGLGCTKFAALMKRTHPHMPLVVSCMADHGLPAKDWRRLDVRIAQVLRGFNFTPHVQHERSTHLHYEKVQHVTD